PLAAREQPDRIGPARDQDARRRDPGDADRTARLAGLDRRRDPHAPRLPPAVGEERPDRMRQPTRTFIAAVADLVLAEARDRDRHAAPSGTTGADGRLIDPPARVADRLPRRTPRRDPDERTRVEPHARGRGRGRGRDRVDAGGAEREAMRSHDSAATRRHHSYLMPSWHKLSSSIATSPPPLAASVGPVHFFGCARLSTQLATSLRASSSSLLAMVQGSCAPSRTAWCHANGSDVPYSQCLSVASSSLKLPGTLLTVLSFSLPLRYSA